MPDWTSYVPHHLQNSGITISSRDANVGSMEEFHPKSAGIYVSEVSKHAHAHKLFPEE